MAASYAFLRVRGRCAVLCLDTELLRAGDVPLQNAFYATVVAGPSNDADAMMAELVKLTRVTPPKKGGR